LTGELIQVGRVVIATPIATKVVNTKVVRHDQDDVGLVARLERKGG